MSGADRVISWQRIAFHRSARSARSCTLASYGRSGCETISQQGLRGGRNVLVRKRLAEGRSSNVEARGATAIAQVISDRSGFVNR